MKRQSLLIACLIVIASLSCKQKKANDLDKGIYAQFDTNYGDFTAKLYYKKAPMTVANFVSLAKGTNPMVSEKYTGKPFYDSLTFHRIVKGFVIQGGDPLGNGQGGPGYQFPNEIDTSLTHNSKGVLSMANAGPDTNGSQFFITLKPTPQLNGNYSVFGQIIKGQKIVDSIGNVEVTKPRNTPVKNVVMKTVTIIKNGKEAQRFDAAKVFQQQVKKAEESAKTKKEELEKEINALAEGFKKTESGLRYKITKTVENGKRPKPGQPVHVYYKGMLKDGKIFDQRLKSDGVDPLTFRVGTGRVIPGWDEGLLLLKEGEKARFIIPPYLAYGSKQRGPIPANSILIFDVYLAKVGK